MTRPYKKNRVYVKYGDRHGKWTVVGLGPQYPRGGKTPHWLCRCECGTLAVIPTNNLHNGMSAQCRECGYASASEKMKKRLRTKDMKEGRTARFHNKWTMPCVCGAAKSPQAKTCADCSVRGRIYDETYEAVADRYGITKQAVSLMVKSRGWDGMKKFYAKKHGGAA